jgi:cysteine synthase A
MIGNTPLLAVTFRYRGRMRVVHAKCEHVNLTGSMKDRMALHILRRAYESGQLRPGMRIAEATSGSTGISFAALGRMLGHPVTIFMPDCVSAERKQLLASYGASLVLVTPDQGGSRGAVELAEQLAVCEPDVFLPRQFSNPANVETHAAATGPEIDSQLDEARLRPDAFVAGVGTGGTVMGVGNYLRALHPRIRIHPIEPAESPILSTGCKPRPHRIQGISMGFVPPIVDLARLDCVIAVSDGDSILMAQKLARIGLGVGISSGCNFLGAVKVQEEIGPGAVVVTVLPDDNKKYLSTDLVREEAPRTGYLSPEIELIGVQVLPRSCEMCVR